MKFIFGLLLIFTVTVFGQELNCHVTVNFEKVPINNRELLQDFANEIESYMNTTRFTNMDPASKIECSLSILFASASSDIDYTAQMIVVSQRPVYHSERNSPMITINDGLWAFKYEKGQALYSNQGTYDPITSFLDFYAYVIIGFDWDTWEEFGGTKYFQQAQNIINLGQNSSFTSGWQSNSSTYSRWGLINELLAEKYSAFRSADFDYHYGLDIYQDKKEEGMNKIVGLVDVLYTMWQKQGGINSVLIKTFFDAKNGEIIDHLKDYHDKTVFEKLKKIDPPHAAKYEALIP
jgi:Domain of unknown function (DUF4835)